MTPEKLKRMPQNRSRSPSSPDKCKNICYYALANIIICVIVIMSGGEAIEKLLVKASHSDA